VQHQSGLWILNPPIRTYLPYAGIGFWERTAMADQELETGLIGGIEKRDIKILDYDPDWPQQFERRAKIITEAIGGSVLRIEHIGSTSVPNLAAKPVFYAPESITKLLTSRIAGHHGRLARELWHPS
jgi:hypothetical protein